MRAEVLGHVARRGGEVRCRCAPLVRVDRLGAVSDVRGDALSVARPEPDLYTRVGTLHREEPATVLVEVRPVRLGRCVEHAAARVARSHDVTVGLYRMARHLACAADRASWNVGAGA